MTSTTQQPRAPSPAADCLACRLTGAAAFTGLGAYAIYEARRQGTFERVRPAGKSVVGGKIQAVLGVVFISVGLARLVLPARRLAPP